MLCVCRSVTQRVWFSDSGAQLPVLFCLCYLTPETTKYDILNYALHIIHLLSFLLFDLVAHTSSFMWEHTTELVKIYSTV